MAARKGDCSMPYRVERIDPQRAALIVVDMENDFVAPGAPLETPAGRAMLPTLKRAITFCREHGIRVIYTTHAHRRDGCDMGRFKDLWPPIRHGAGLVDGEPGSEIYLEIAPRTDEIVITKRLQRLLRHRSGDHLARLGGRHSGHL